MMTTMQKFAVPLLLSLVVVATSPTGSLAESNALLLNEIIPTFDAELETLRERIEFVLDAGSPEDELTELRAAKVEVQYKTDPGAQYTYEKAIHFLSTRKDNIRGNGCEDEDVQKFIESKWTALRLQKLATGYVRQLSQPHQALRQDAMKTARKSVSEVEKKCVTKFRRMLKSEGPQPEFNPDLPGKNGREDEPPVQRRVKNPDLGPMGALPQGDETDNDELVRLGISTPDEGVEAIARKEAERAAEFEELMVEMRSTSNFQARCEIRDRIRSKLMNG